MNTHLSPLSSLKSELGGSRGAVAVVGSLQVFSTHFHFHKSMFIYSFSTQVGVYSLSGPIVGKLVSRFGPRAVCISGAIVARSGQEILPYHHHSYPTAQLWPPCILLCPLPYHGLLKLWPCHRIWLWSHVSVQTLLEEETKNLQVSSLRGGCRPLLH